MTQETHTPDTTLRIEKEISAPVAKVFEAWSDPAIVAKWMGPGDVKCGNVDIDLKVGGKYNIEMITTDCEHPIAVGEYKEIVPNEKLQFTWSWKDSGMPLSLVTVEFKGQGESTILTLLHENLPDEESAKKHNEGWEGCLANLIKCVS